MQEMSVEGVLLRLGELQAESEVLREWLLEAAGQEHAAAHGHLGREMQEKLEELSVQRNEFHAQAGAGRSGYANTGLVSQEQVEARKRAILQEGGFVR